MTLYSLSNNNKEHCTTSVYIITRMVIFILTLCLTLSLTIQVSEVRWDRLDHPVRQEEPDKKDQSDCPAEMGNRVSREAQDYQVLYDSEVKF